MVARWWCGWGYSVVCGGDTGSEGRQLAIREMSVKETAIKLTCKPLIIHLGWVNVEQNN